MDAVVDIIFGGIRAGKADFDRLHPQTLSCCPRISPVADRILPADILHMGLVRYPDITVSCNTDMDCLQTKRLPHGSGRLPIASVEGLPADVLYVRLIGYTSSVRGSWKISSRRCRKVPVPAIPVHHIFCNPTYSPVVGILPHLITGGSSNPIVPLGYPVIKGRVISDWRKNTVPPAGARIDSRIVPCRPDGRAEGVCNGNHLRTSQSSLIVCFHIQINRQRKRMPLNQTEHMISLACRSLCVRRIGKQIHAVRNPVSFTLRYVILPFFIILGGVIFSIPTAENGKLHACVLYGSPVDRSLELTDINSFLRISGSEENRLCILRVLCPGFPEGRPVRRADGDRSVLQSLHNSIGFPICVGLYGVSFLRNILQRLCDRLTV